ncbi:MAG TPA: flavin reductase family protein [Desulfomonilia bacterium]
MNNEWQKVLDRFSYGIYIVSVKNGPYDNAMIASWVTQCSHEPPQVCVAIRRNRLSHSQILNAGAFSIGILPQGETTLIKRFKIPDWQHKFEGLETRHTILGNLMPQSVIGYLDLELVNTIETGDHTLFIGKAVSGEFLHDIEPMTVKDYDGCYRGNA